MLLAMAQDVRVILKLADRLLRARSTMARRIASASPGDARHHAPIANRLGLNAPSRAAELCPRTCT
jgi:(p)ppGpp synthase/HD superfamily hydrolase